MARGVLREATLEMPKKQGQRATTEPHMLVEVCAHPSPTMGAREHPWIPLTRPFSAIVALNWSSPASRAVSLLLTLTPVSARACVCRLRPLCQHQPRPPQS